MFSVSSWIVGAVVGLILCLIIVLILQNTAFKNMNMKILYIIMFVLFGVAGGYLQYTYCSSDPNKYPTPQEQIAEITTTIEDN